MTAHDFSASLDGHVRRGLWAAALLLCAAAGFGVSGCAADAPAGDGEPHAGSASLDGGSVVQAGAAGTNDTAGASGNAAVGARDSGAAQDAAVSGDASSDVSPDAGADAGGSAVGRECKRGVAYNDELAADAPAFGDTIGWWYDWSTVPAADVTSAFGAAEVEFVPMVWTGPPKRSIDAQALVDSIPAGARYLLAFNEPNFGVQASLTPQQAADAWPQLEQIAKARGLKLVSPAVNYCGGDCNQTDPFTWLDEFFAACVGCQVDYVAFHWYACSLDALKWVVDKYETRYGKPVWLTEFACLDDPGDHSAAGQLAYMQQAVPFLESDPMVFRYAWFIGRSSTPGAIDLFAGPGELTTLGSAYAKFAGDCR